MNGDRLACRDYALGRCRSCGWIERRYDAQLHAKQAEVARVLGPHAPADWTAPFPSPLAGFRNKAKLVVGGDLEQPTLGILDARQHGVDLVGCPLYPPALQVAFEPLRDFVRTARLPPYDVAGRRGELKHLLLTVAEDSGALMLRFVLRSQEPLARIRKHLPALQARLPQLRVVSANLQPRHAAVLEGDTEILLTDAASLPIGLNGLRLFLRPGGFFQTNTTVAAALYRQARDWCAALSATRILDLFCGVGGFALHLAGAGRQVAGIELSAAAIASARESAQAAGLDIDFRCGDATRAEAAADLWVVNPPRRGLGADLCAQVLASPARWLLYSSCNPESLAADLARLPGFRCMHGRLFDMFPHTMHSEVLVLLQRSHD